jgi:S-adenosylmethionine:tRNA ribosyltransferase-isomerase
MQYIPISNYNYQLPAERIAKYPLENRDLSKLLVYSKGKIHDDVFSNIHNHIPTNSLLVFNDTRVIQARLKFYKASGAEIEIFCLEPHSPADYYQNFQQKENCSWKCLVGNLKKWKEGRIFLHFIWNDNKELLEAELEQNFGEYQQIKFYWNNKNISFANVLEQAGNTPIPPYLNRPSEDLDRSRYQTIYSIEKGSVAAPTAGLHFTPAVFEKLEIQDVTYCGITLHVGAGTFRPVKDENAANHPMHTEHFFIKKSVLEQLLNNVGNVTSVGTTSMRALESIYWMGVQLIDKQENPFFIDQWDWKVLHKNYTTKQVIEALINYCAVENISEIAASTRIMIVPGYTINMVNRLITNFHQPQSTLLLLVAAFVGDSKWKEIYTHALANDYRFLSYGDSSLLFSEQLSVNNEQ